MMMEMEGPAASGKANGAKSKATNFLMQEYRAPALTTTTFEHVSVAALRVAHLAARHGLNLERAALVAPMIFGEVAKE